MKGTIMKLPIILIFFFLVFGVGLQDNRAIAESSGRYAGRIAAIGDSLTAGLGVAEEFNYPSRLEKKLASDGKHYQVVNAGVSGETTSGTLSRLDWLLTMKPDIVILVIGANDGLRGLDPARAKANLEKILDRLQKEGIVTILAGMKMVWNMGPEYTKAFNRIYPDLAGQYDLLFMPFFLEDVAMVPELNLRDGLHPNGDGYRVVTENIYPFVLEAVSRLEEGGHRHEGGEGQ